MSHTIRNLEPDQQYEAKVIARWCRLVGIFNYFSFILFCFRESITEIDDEHKHDISFKPSPYLRITFHAFAFFCYTNDKESSILSALLIIISWLMVSNSSSLLAIQQESLRLEWFLRSFCLLDVAHRWVTWVGGNEPFYSIEKWAARLIIIYVLCDHWDSWTEGGKRWSWRWKMKESEFIQLKMLVLKSIQFKCFGFPMKLWINK